MHEGLPHVWVPDDMFSHLQFNLSSAVAPRWSAAPVSLSSVSPLQCAIDILGRWCSCPQFQELALCRHVLGVGIHSREIQVPAQFDTVRVQGTRKRGRPRRTAGRRQRQPPEAPGPGDGALDGDD